MIADMERLLTTVGAALELVPSRYAVGGSVASTHHGEPRMTNDLDVLVEMGENDIAAFRSAFGSDWYMPDGVLERQRRDVLGMLKTSGDSMDFTYLVQMAEVLGLDASLRSCLRDAGLSG